MSRFRRAAAVFAFTFLACFHALGISPQATDKLGSPSPADGIWLGTLHAGSIALRIQIHLTTDAAGHEICAMDSLDQGAMGTPCTVQSDSGLRLAIAVPAVQGHWQGALSSDGKTLTGTWTQGASLPLNFDRQATALGPSAAAAPTFQPALPPVTAANIESVLTRDLAPVLKSGEFGRATGLGISVAVVTGGDSRVFSLGAARPDSIFEIGSLSKTFTGLILARMVMQKKVRLNQPVRQLLPPGAVAKPAGPEITLLDLATQHSGLPRLPSNLHPANPANPYADYTAANLYAYLGAHGVARPANAGFLYSNLGFGLLGQALANRAGQPWPTLLQREITTPLDLRDTTVALTPAQRARFLSGHGVHHHVAAAWTFAALAGACAVRSTAADLLTFLQANLHPPAALAPAFALDHKLRTEALPGTRIALAWFHDAASGDYWHDGATGGFTAYAFFNPQHDYAAVVLLNNTIAADGTSFADQLGQHISQRLSGRPAVTLAPF